MLAANPYYANGMPFPYIGGLDAGRRKNATRGKSERTTFICFSEVTMPLKKWLSDHRKYPCKLLQPKDLLPNFNLLLLDPNKAEKMILAIITKMSLTQVFRIYNCN